jgi:hypothetical protein
MGKMDDILGIPEKPTEIVKREEDTSITKSDGVSEYKEDFHFSRKNLKNVINVATDALDKVSDLAAQAESPSAFDSVASLVNALTLANRGLMNLHGKRESTVVNTTDEMNITNNFTFNGTTKDLLETVNKTREEALRNVQRSDLIDGEVVGGISHG